MIGNTFGSGLIGNPDAVHYTSQSEIILYNLYSESGYLIQIRAQHSNAYCPYSSPILLLSPKYNITADSSPVFNNYKQPPEVLNKNVEGILENWTNLTTLPTTSHPMRIHKYVSTKPTETYENQTTFNKLTNWDSQSLSTSTSNSSVITIGLLLSVALTTIISIILLITLVILCVHRNESRRKWIRKKMNHILPKINKYLLFKSSTDKTTTKNDLQSVMLICGTEVNIISTDQLKIIKKLGENSYGQTYYAKLYQETPQFPSVHPCTCSKLTNSIAQTSLNDDCLCDNVGNDSAKIVTSIVANQWNHDISKSLVECHIFTPIQHQRNNNLLAMNLSNEVYEAKNDISLSNTITNHKSYCLHVFVQDLCYAIPITEKYDHHKSLSWQKLTYKFSYNIQKNRPSDKLNLKLKKLLDNRRMIDLIQNYAKFDHPNIVKFYGLCLMKLTDKNSSYSFVTEFCKHGSLDIYLKKVLQGNQFQKTEINMNPFNLRTAVKMLFEISSGLEYLSSQSFTIENFTGSSVLLDSSFTCKIRIRLPSTLVENEENHLIKMKVNTGFFQPLLLNNEQFVYQLEDNERLNKNENIISSEIKLTENLQKRITHSMDYNIYDMYKIIIDKSRTHTEKSDSLYCQSVNSRLDGIKGITDFVSNSNSMKINCYFNNIWSFGQLITELIIAHLILANKQKLTDNFQVGHSYKYKHIHQPNIPSYENISKKNTISNENSIPSSGKSHFLTLQPTFLFYENSCKLNNIQKCIYPSEFIEKFKTLPNIRPYTILDHIDVNHNCIDDKVNQLEKFSNPYTLYSNEFLKDYRHHEDFEIFNLLQQLTSSSSSFISEEIYFDYLCRFIKMLIPQTKLDKLLFICRHPCTQLRPTFNEIREQLNYAYETVTTKIFDYQVDKSTINNNHDHIENLLIGLNDCQKVMKTNQSNE
ncbi:unnamed protein product [Heterobilharzia americana]|nr:unnamed protein product [Heterobilharzia americana]